MEFASRQLNSYLEFAIGQRPSSAQFQFRSASVRHHGHLSSQPGVDGEGATVVRGVLYDSPNDVANGLPTHYRAGWQGLREFFRVAGADEVHRTRKGRFEHLAGSG